MYLEQSKSFSIIFSFYCQAWIFPLMTYFFLLLLVEYDDQRMSARVKLANIRYKLRRDIALSLRRTPELLLLSLSLSQPQQSHLYRPEYTHMSAFRSFDFPFIYVRTPLPRLLSSIPRFRSLSNTLRLRCSHSFFFSFPNNLPMSLYSCSWFSFCPFFPPLHLNTFTNGIPVSKNRNVQLRKFS